MIPDNDVTAVTERETEQRGYWYKPLRCSICTRFLWFRAMTLKEPANAPEPLQQWVLCQSCHQALLLELERASLRSPARLRIAMGLVAAERAPKRPQQPIYAREKELQREISWFMWLLLLFAILHLAVFAILLAVPR